MEFKKYPHLERFGTAEVQGIELGTCHVFPKIDGSNASLWWHPENGLQAGSRNRHLSLDADNGGFLEWALARPEITAFFQQHPMLRLYGEWLIPHSLKTYRDDAWQRFYVFDVGSGDALLHYDEYKPLLDAAGLDYIPPISVLRNADYEQLIGKLAANVFLVQDGKGAGEGIVLKNYGYANKYGRQTWAKIVTSEFKEKHAKEMGVGAGVERKLVEEEIALAYATQALCEKEYAKIDVETGWTSRLIPRLLNTVYYSVVKEDAWDFVKEHKNPTIDFKRLQHFVFAQVKKHMPQLF
jgi:hypothetical protein